MRGQVKHIDEGVKKVRGELKHHKKPDGPNDKFLARMEASGHTHNTHLTNTVT